MLAGLAIGIVVAVMRLSGNVLHAAGQLGLDLVLPRGAAAGPADLLVQPRVPGPFRVDRACRTGPAFISWQTNSLITPFTAALLGLAFTESAYAAEMIRAGIQAVPRGQVEAAQSLGMTSGQAMRRIVLPQALRIVIPPIGNDTISMLKFTSLVSVLALPDLLYSAQEIYARTYQTIPMLLVATLWYLVLTTILTVIEHLIEKRLRRGHAVRGRRTAVPASALAAAASLAGLRAGGRAMTGEPLVVVDRVRKSFRSTWCSTGSVSRCWPARCAASSARPVPGRRPCCGASTGLRRSTPA